MSSRARAGRSPIGPVALRPLTPRPGHVLSHLPGHGSGRSSARSLVGRAQHVPRAAQGVDHRLAPDIDLLAQVGDVELDDVRLAAEVVVPDPVEDLRLAQHPARVVHQIAEQLELGGGEVDRVAPAGDLVGVLVQGQVPDDEGGGVQRLRGAGPAQQGAQPGDHLLEAERLGDVVVGAAGEALDPVGDGVAGGQEDHREARLVVVDAAHHLEAVEVREHDVEDRRVGADLVGDLYGLLTAGGGPHLPALVAHRHREQLGQRRLVVHREDTDGRAVGTGQSAVGTVGHSQRLPRRTMGGANNPVGEL
ncbi:hypothetical protein SDC9_101815 [bioreactor metagenome]|uniref:Uncharacterized protein n=1 Tax=bioreactor metagenome TaxID=1076179 RepID=A0A645APL1_9ZZZZ